MPATTQKVSARRTRKPAISAKKDGMPVAKTAASHKVKEHAITIAGPKVRRKHSISADTASMLHIRVLDSLKKKATKTLEEIGLTPSEAVRLFLHRVVIEQRLPLDLYVPNAETQAAILEAREIAAQPGRFKDAEAMFASLEKAG